MNNLLKITTVIALTTTTIISLQKDSFAVTFNAANDFSGVSNPNGVWSYGFSNTLGGTFNLYTNNADPNFNPASLDVWNRLNPDSEPAVFHNYTANPFSFFTVNIAPNQLAFHPGSSGEYSIVRFIAPQSGNYNLATIFTGIDTVGTTTDVHILQNNTSLFNNSIVGLGSTQSFSSNLPLVTGDIIDFAVGFGGNGYFFDSTGLDVTITQQNTQPTPESSNLLGLMLLGGSLALTKVKFKGKNNL